MAPAGTSGDLRIGISDGFGFFDGIHGRGLSLGGWNAVFDPSAVLVAQASTLIVVMFHIPAPLFIYTILSFLRLNDNINVAGYG